MLSATSPRIFTSISHRFFPFFCCQRCFRFARSPRLPFTSSQTSWKPALFCAPAFVINDDATTINFGAISFFIGSCK
ncbi:unnamed protein product [Meloidogyne enterolobii]|uniref:Uncharacterized protein n=1 Tax=Meloidogyne enterolobii TaxID=390850 RepID=A0ACB0YWP3_MELEN